MDEHRSPHVANEAWNEQFARALAQQHERLQQFDDEQGGELERIESQLSEQFEAIGAELEKERHGVDQRQQELDRLASELESQETSLQQRRAELEAREARLREGLKEAKELEQVRIAELEDELRQRDERLAAQARQIDDSQQRLNELQGELESLQNANAELQAELSATRAESQQALAQRDAEIESLRSTNEKLQSRLAESHDQLAKAVEGSASAEAWEASQRQLHDELEAARQSAIDLEQRLAEVEAEREDLAARLAQADQTAAQGSATTDSEAVQQLNDRLKMALDDLRELRERNVRLEADLARASQQAGSVAPSATTTGLDWEAEKRRIVAALEADDGDDPQHAADRLRVEEAIRTTEQIVEEKDRQIEELIAQIAQTASDDNAASELAAVDHDDMVQRERERLKQLQAEWEEKLRQAEVDLSVERAKIARQRAEIEEKLRRLPAQQGGMPTADHADAPTSPPSRPARGRWLARLGLKDDDES